MKDEKIVLEENTNENEQESAVITPDEITVSAVEQDKKAPKKTSFFKTRSFKYGSMSTAIIALFVVVVIAANLLLSALSDRFSWSIDLTSTDLYELSEATIETINSIDDDVDVKITVMSSESSFPPYLLEPIKRFANLSDNISTEFIDIEKNPSAITSYDEEYGVSEWTVIISNGGRFRVFNATDYLSYDQSSGVTTITLEDKLSAGLLYVTNDIIPTVYFFKGHGEDGYQSLLNTVELTGSETKEVNIFETTPTFDQSSKMIVIANPTSDYSPTEIRMLQDFMSNNNEFGRSIMYFSAPGAPSLPNLEAFLKEWGIVLNNDIVLEGETLSLQQQANQMAVYHTTDAIMDSGVALTTDNSAIYVPDARSIDLLFDESSSYKTQAVLSTSADSYSKDMTVPVTSYEKKDGDKSGASDIAVLSMYSKYDSNVQKQSYLFVSGSTGVITNENYSYYGASDMFKTLYKVMIDETDDILTETHKNTSSPFANVTSTEEDVFFYLAVIALPLLIIVVGLVIFARRRFL